MKTKEGSVLPKRRRVVKKKHECAVCSGKRVHMAKLPCGHRFCKPCTSRWTKQESSCPLCRAAVCCYQYRGKTINVEKKSQAQEMMVFETVVAATTEFLSSSAFQSQVRDDVAERKPGAELLANCIHRSLYILAEEENRENFNAVELQEAIVAIESIMELAL